MAKGSGNNRTVSSTTATASRSNNTLQSGGVAAEAIQRETSIRVLRNEFDMARDMADRGYVPSEDARQVMEAVDKRIAEIKREDIAKVTALKMPKTYDSTEITVGEQRYGISHVPTGYGRDRNYNGRFTVYINEGDYRDFRYTNDPYTFMTKNTAWKEVKEFLKQKVRNS